MHPGHKATLPINDNKSKAVQQARSERRAVVGGPARRPSRWTRYWDERGEGQRRIAPGEETTGNNLHQKLPGHQG
ncbi:hypothetical protein E2C01_089430 [Portunus trituberculatus]|uniref:Uncharacterized protein n=1 Tax=Portunus trituberculatus TaxID=210409 RepID=A0A5B7JMD1_PORTR|nr:hypothetical protein [Portunus trituberculatus]